MTSLGERIAEGRTAEVYVWGEGQVLKLFREWFPADAVEHEARVARAVHAAGLAVPAVGEVVEVEGRLGLAYERVEGPSMVERLRSRPWTVRRYARLLAGIHAGMHGSRGPAELPAHRERLRAKLLDAGGLPTELREAALTRLARMPEGDRICHGDFHPSNVLMAERGPVIIDWIDATRGNPAADAARSWVVLMGAASRGSRWSKWHVRRLCSLYCRRYFQLRPADREQLMAWRPIVAAARLSENIAEEREWLMGVAEKGLSHDARGVRSGGAGWRR